MSWKGANQSWGANQSKGGGNQSWGGNQPSWGSNQGSNQSWGGKAGGKDGGKGKAAPQKVVAPSNTGKGAAATPVAAGKGGAKGGAQPWGQQSWGAQQSWAAPAPAKVDKAPEYAAKLTKFTTELNTAESVTTTMLSTSKMALENEKATAASLKVSLDGLEKQQTKLNDIMKNLGTESGEARKAGPTCLTSANELAKLLVKVRGIWQTVTQQMNLLKPKVAKLQAAADIKAKETKDANAFKVVLAKARADVTSAESAVADVTRKANPIVATLPEDGELKDKKVAAVEEAAVGALKKLETVRTEMNEKIKGILAYAPEAKKTAQTALMELQKKITDALKVVTVYKTFKTQLPRLAENHKTVADITEKLTGHEAAITKASDVAKKGTLTKANLESIDAGLEPVQTAIKAVNASLTKLRAADAVTQDKVAKLRTRADELSKKVVAVVTKVKGQRDILKSAEAIETATETAGKLEGNWKDCQEAEMPFLMGVEVLAAEENDKALQGCKDAVDTATKNLNAARNLIKQTLNESKTYEKELAEKTTAALNPILKELEGFEVKFNKYRKDLNERKLLPILSDALDAVVVFEKAAKAAELAAKALAAPEGQQIAELSEAIEKSKTALNDATDKGNKARSTSQAKQKEAKANQTHPSLVAINDGLNGANTKVEKVRAVLKVAEQFVKTNNALTAGEEKVKEAEAAVKAAKKAVPKGAFTVDNVTAVDEACANARKVIGTTAGVLQPALNGCPAKATEAKAALEKLVERKTAAQESLSELVTSSKERREEALSASYLAEAETKTAAAEAAVSKVDEVEAPWLIGTSLNSEKAQAQLTKCLEVTKEVQEAVAAARAYTSQKQIETNKFGAEAATKAKEAFAAMAERMKKVGTKLATFEKDTRERSKESRMVEASEMAEKLEASVKKTVTAAAIFTKDGGDKLSEAEANEPLKAFLEVEKEQNIKQASFANFLLARLKEQAGNKEHLEAVKGMQETLKVAKEQVAELKKATAPHEKRALGTTLLAELKEQVGTLDAEVKKATDACAPLLEQGGGSFLTCNAIQTLANALQAHMKAKDLTVDAVFKEASKGGKISEKSFIAYLVALPDAIEHDELSAFSDERRLAIFKHLASGKSVTQEDFAGIFRQEYTCNKQMVVTDKFEVEGAETVCKAESNAVVECFGVQKDGEGGLTRSECKIGDKTGWITLKQEKGGRGLTPVSSFKVFASTMDKALSEGSAAVNKVQNSLNGKLKQGGVCEEGALKDAREEMAKFKDVIIAAVKSMGELKGKAGSAKNGFTSKEVSERNAHIEARNQKEAAPFLVEPKAKTDALEPDAKAVEEAGAPMASLMGEELQSFATPASVQEAVEKLAAAVNEKATAARTAIKEQREAVMKVTPQTSGTAEAKKQLAAMIAKVDALTRQSTKTTQMISSKCKSLVTAKMAPTAEAIRKLAAKSDKTIEEFFASLAKGDKISEAAFCKMAASLEEPLAAETAKLVCRKLEADGISKDTFMSYVVIYYKIVRTIAFTDGMDITKCKTLRKGEEGEIVEVLQGPVTDEANDLTRIKARSCNDDKQVGWVTVCGSKGTAFLEKSTKPGSNAAAKPVAATTTGAAKPVAATTTSAAKPVAATTTSAAKPVAATTTKP